MVERLLAFLDHVAGDPDVEDDDPGGGDPCDALGLGSERDDQDASLIRMTPHFRRAY